MSKSDTLLTEQPSQKGSAYGKTIYVSEDVFSKLMEMNYSGFVSIAGEKILSLKGLSLDSMTFTEDRYLPKNTIIEPNPEEVKRLQKERFENMLEDLKVFGELYGERLWIY